MINRLRFPFGVIPVEPGDALSAVPVIVADKETLCEREARTRGYILGSTNIARRLTGTDRPS